MLKQITAGVVLLAACLSQAVYADANNKRLITIDGSITEIVYALNAESQLVGVDTTSIYPEAASELPNVGYMRALSSEGILSLAPDLIITTPDAGPQKVLDNLKQAGLNIVSVDTDRTIEGVINKIEQVAKALGLEQSGAQLSQRIRNKAQHLSTLIENQASTPQIMFLLAAGRHGVMISGKNTQADAMIKLLGGENVAQEFESYKPLTAEGILSQDPDVIIIANNTKVPFDPESFPTIKLTKAYKNGRIISENSMLVLGFGPRITNAIERLASQIYSLDNSLASN